MIDFQWTGPAHGGVADLVYLLFGGVLMPGGVDSEPANVSDFFRLSKEFVDEMKRFYWSSLASAGVYEDVADFELHFDLELLDYWSTALPYLLSDLSPKHLAKNAVKYGFLTCVLVLLSLPL